jgi:hypothetical protein
MSVVSYASEIIMPITPSDTQPITDTDGARRRGSVLCKGAAGNIVIVDSSGQKRTYPIALGEVTPFIVSRIDATNTTATGLSC